MVCMTETSDRRFVDGKKPVLSIRRRHVYCVEIVRLGLDDQTCGIR
jgi:hypothetical protein